MLNFTSPIPLIVAAIFPAFLDQCSRADESVALGILARDRVALTATANEIVVDLPLAEGSKVKVGDTLVQLDGTLQTSKLALAQAELEKAQATLLKLQVGAREEEIAIAEAEVAGAVARLADAEAIYQRNLKLVENSIVTEAQVANNLAVRDSARAELRSAKETLKELKNGTRPEDLAVAEANVRAQEASVKAEQTILDELTVVATRDGILDSLPWNLGERVALGSPVAVLITGEVPYARVYIPEPHRIKLKTGDKLEVHVDGLDAPLDGVVRWISDDPSFTPYFGLNKDDRTRLVYLAEIDLPSASPDLPPGIPVQVPMP
ncbi:HlyD family efflux transporter periplasmic adaptor subunit [Halocynthiibacter sp. C4]|uniref:HlyD family secretion protein n=1 Tax=Halocynthiibacter sp. C4 TaxID=2992758 RepID=UPI00237A2DC9|nr:HlyD family efflux transporter periplasmic adaptor subunit [Halocynthiibacter sp. C4]MDE0591448.1 HlyD family efflux transporter periplasmic adaptor subunit [Halocynthiibacter sp. C4]